MAKRIIEISVNDEYVVGSGVVIGAEGADESVILRVAFGDAWAGLNIYATFRDSKGESPTVELLMPSMRVLDATVIKYDVVVPRAATAHAGKMSVVFSGFAVSEVSSYEIKTGTEENIKLVYRDAVINTTNAYFRVLPSDFSALDVKDHAEATVLEQVLSEINGFDEKETERRAAEVERKEIFARFCEDYSAGKFKGDKGDPGSVNVVDGPGDSEKDAMSQKATTRELNNLKGKMVEAVGGISLDFTEENAHILTNGSTISSLTPTDGGSFRLCVEECVEGDVFCISGTGGGSARLWAFVDSSLNVLTVSDEYITLTNEKVIAPQNASYIILHTSTPNEKCYKGEFISTHEVKEETEKLCADLADTQFYVGYENWDALKNVWKSGTLVVTVDNNGVKEADNLTRVRTSEIAVSVGETLKIKPNGQRWNLYTWENGVYKGNYSEWQTDEREYNPTVDTVYRLTASRSDNSAITPETVAVSLFKTTKNPNSLAKQIERNTVKTEPHNKNTGNFSIVCAKEHTYSDGTAPVIEYYLLEEVGTKRFYISKDLMTKQYAFTFNTEYTNYYAFGITNNGDVVACRLSDSLGTTGKDDARRMNPICWLASEEWQVQHEVDFGDRLKPCGWISNCGFRNLPDGDALFCEYTRMTAATANVWKLSGSPEDASNWAVKKSFEVTSTDNLTGLKHIHTVQYDHFTGVVYFSTGDDDDNSKIYYSLDLGETWTVLGTPSQKYCRNLNFTFTKDYIYYVPDYVSANKYLFRATRAENGVMEFNTIEDWVKLVHVGSAASYGTVYLESINAILILDRCDGEEESIPLQLVDLTDGTRHTVGTLESPSGEQLVGFRTRFTEFYPKDCRVRFGFSLYKVGWSDSANHIKGFGNEGQSTAGYGANNINNLELIVNKVNDNFTVLFNTYY